MIQFFTNRVLAQSLGINLARWKRWSREFLPPDPLGGLQSGFAREYSVKEAFTVYMAGHLVSDLRFLIPEAKQILSDLQAWLEEHRFLLNRNNRTAQNNDQQKTRYRIYLRPVPDGSRLTYQIREIISDTPEGGQEPDVHCERYLETRIEPSGTLGGISMRGTRVIELSDLIEYFLDRLG